MKSQAIAAATEQVNAVPQAVSLWYRDSTSDKVYDLKLEQCETGWSVYAAWGRRGSTLQADYKCQREEFHAAKKIFDSVLKQKLAKGYQYSEQPKDIVFNPELLTRIESERELKSYLRSCRYYAQIKRDGRRLTVVAEMVNNNQAIYGYNKLGQVVELDTELRKAVVKLLEISRVGGIILDGEWEPSGFWAWDMLYFKSDMRGLRYEDRLDLLEKLLTADKVVALGMFRLVETARTEDEKLALFERAKKTRAEGLALKNRDALYRGGRAGQHYKYKLEITGSFFVGPKPANKLKDGKRSMGVYCYDKGRKRFMATVKVPECYAMPKDGQVVEIRYLYVLPGFDAKLYGPPVYFGVVRDDVRPQECTAQQLKLKQDAEDAAA